MKREKFINEFKEFEFKKIKEEKVFEEPKLTLEQKLLTDIRDLLKKIIVLKFKVLNRLIMK